MDAKIILQKNFDFIYRISLYSFKIGNGFNYVYFFQCSILGDKMFDVSHVSSLSPFLSLFSLYFNLFVVRMEKQQLFEWNAQYETET